MICDSGYKFQVMICSLLIAYYSLFTAHCQVPKTLTMELEARSSENYNIIPLGEKGLIVFYENTDRHFNSRVWKFAKYDTVFKELWNKEITIQKSMSSMKSYYDSKTDKFYILFLKTKRYLISRSSVKNGDFAIITLNLSDGEFNITKGLIPGRANVTEFKVIDNNAYIGGNSCPSNVSVYMHALFSITLIPMLTGFSFYKFNPLILNVNLTNGNLRMMHNGYKGNSFLLNEQINSQDKSYIITTIDKNIVNRKKSYLCFNTYDGENNLIRAGKIIIPPDSTFVSARFFRIGNDNFLTGTYKNIHRHRIRFSPFYQDANELSLTSDGLFFSKIVNEKPAFLRFYNFSKFHDFYNIINSKIKKKVNFKGKKFNTDYQLLLHDIIQRGNEYILVAEAYYPEYHLEYFWTSDAYGRFYQESREVFDGYRYTHSIITAFDSKGNILWNNSFEIGNILTYNLKERVNVMFDEDNLVLVYSNEGKIASKIINKNQVIQAKEEDKLDISLNQNDAKTNLSSDIDFWYKNYFITFGYKSFSDDKSRFKNTRTVFYFSKIAFQ
jgi:hypothetical protein